jgi:hypothetical protein
MNYKLILFSILVFLIITVLIKYDIFTSSPELLNAVDYKQDVIIETSKKIADITQKARQDFTEELFVNANTSSDVSVMLFFSQSCVHCQKFYPTWKQVSGNLESSVHNTEIECQKEKTICKQYNVSIVPTVIVSVNGNETRFNGDMDAVGLADKLASLGVPMKPQTTEGFVDYISAAQVEAEGDSRKSKDPDCPYMSFYEGDPNNYCADSNYLYGCINASPGSGIDAFDGAFGIIASYVNSIPSSELDKKKKCMSQYSHIVKAWNLCNPLKLMKKRNYSQDIDMNLSKPRFLNVNYNDNKEAVDAINYACGISNV